MSLLYTLGLAALGALVPLVALYLLKQKRQELQVPASFLWRHALEDLRASSLFQRLRTPLLFFLQVAAIVLFGLAAAGASLDVGIGDQPRRVIVVVDRSRSMSAADEDGKTRIEVARELCRDAIDGLRGTDELMLVGFDSNAEVIVAFTGDEDLLLRAVDELDAHDLPSRPAAALRLASSFAKASPGFDPEVIVISDGAVTGDLPVLSCKRMFAPVGTSGANQGIAEVRLTQAPGERPQVFVRAENGDREEVTRLLVLKRDGEVSDARELVLPARGEAVAFFEIEPAEGETPVVVEVRLDGADVLSADDAVSMVLRPSVARFGLLVRDRPSIYLDARKLEALHPGLAMVELTPEEAVTSLEAGTHVDLIVYDGVVPEKIPDVVGQFYVGVLPPESGLAETGRGEYPVIIDWNHTHPVTVRCQFDDVLIEETIHLSGHERSEVLIDTTHGPLLLLSPVPGREVVVLAFDPAKSNLPLKLAWPLLLANSLDYLLAEVQRDEEAPLFATGSAITAGDAAAFIVTTPDGLDHEPLTTPDGRMQFIDTTRAGVYRVTVADSDDEPDPRSFALLDSDEIDIEPRGELVLGGDTVEATPGTIRRHFLLRDPLLLLALGILLLEWALWCGRR